MPFDASITIDGGAKRRVLHCTYSVSQSADHVTGKTTSEVYAANISLEVESIKDSDLWKLAVHPTKRCKGEIKFKSPDDEEQDFKIISFEDAAIVSYSESMDARNKDTMVESLKISCKKIDVDGVVLEKKW